MGRPFVFNDTTPCLNKEDDDDEEDDYDDD